MSGEAAAASGDDSDQVGLTDVMLAMDIVDTLRHEQRLVERALNEDARREALIEQVRSTYAAQGIEVSEATVASAVQSLTEREFTYEPPPAGLKTRLLHGWVARGRIARGVSLFAGVAALIGGAYVGFVVWPESRERVAAIGEVNAAIGSVKLDIQTLDRRRVSLARALDAIDGAALDTAYSQALASEQRAAADALDRASRLLESAATLSFVARLEKNAPAGRVSVAEDGVERQREALDGVRSALDDAEASVQRLNRLGALPGELELLRDELVALAVDDEADREAAERHAAALAQLRQGDVAGAERIADSMKQTIGQLSREFVVRVVSRPGESSGIIRGPDVNPGANNYYLIVEALADDGTRVPLPIRSEEDGSERQVTKWGVRVPRSVFERVRDDKLDDGIIQGDTVGRKRRGVTDIDYSIATSGGLIHTWEEPR